MDKICYALHNMPTFKDRPGILEEEIFRLLFESAEISKFTPEERIKYIHDMTTERDIRNQIRFAEKKGASQDRITIAKQLLSKGIPPETVAECTGLSAEEIAKL